MTMPVCKRCSSEFPMRQGQNIYCRPCREDAYKERDKRKWEKRSGAVPIGGNVICRDCSTVFVKTNCHQRFCQSCKTERKRERFLRYRRKHPERVAKTQAENGKRKRSKPDHKEKARYWSRVHAEKNADNPRWFLSKRISQLIKSGLRGGKEGKSWRELVEFSREDLYRHLEKQFLRGMSWENMGQWHIDHIVPLSSFEYTRPEDPGFKDAWSLTNLRPLWANDNIQKRAKRLFLI